MYSQMSSGSIRTFGFRTAVAPRSATQEPVGGFPGRGLAESIDIGETVFSEGESAENVYEVIQGVVRLYKLLADGRRQITGFLFPGDLLGFAHGGHYIYAAEAITELRLRRYSRARFERMVDEVPGLAQHILKVTFAELRGAQDQMLLLGRKSAAEKIASFLLNMAERQGNAEEVRLAMGRADIADYLGLTKETVCKTLSELKREGVIAAQSASCIELRDRGQLEELAAGELSHPC